MSAFGLAEPANYIEHNRYFGPYINSYFNHLNMINKSSNQSEHVDFYDVDYGYPKCPNCRIVSQLTDINYLGNKKLQYDNLVQKLGYKPNYVPKTISFESHQIKSNKIKKLFKISKIYILKPENSLGRLGVQVIKSYLELLQWVEDHLKYKSWIIQEYITNCLLYQKKKFHLRIYPIIVRNKRSLKVFIYQKGFMYTSKNAYDIDNCQYPDIGLSGENSPQQVKVFPEDFLSYYNQAKKKYQQIIPQIDHIIAQTIEVCQDKFACPNQQAKNFECFKLLGYDLLIDDQFKVWLLEINARFISLKYPPEDFKKEMYDSILDLVWKKKADNFRLVLNYNLVKHQEGFKSRLSYSYKSRSWIGLVGLFIFIIIIILFVKFYKN